MAAHDTAGDPKVARKLERYADKRDPTRTNEPFGPEPMHSATPTLAGRFVVHQHAATRMHFDLRIEVAGTLKSFAVPRGPTLDTTEKRLAVHTEDHPLEYLEFEAVIPAGNYGAGSMILWDTGTVHYLENSAERGLEVGKVDFVLSGFKLRGRYGLIATKPKPGDKTESWLLVKKPDAHASAERDILAEEPESVLSGLTIDELAHSAERAAEIVALARQLGAAEKPLAVQDIVPMRCTESGARLDDRKSLYELKLDGVRVLAERHGEHVQLRYRTQRNATGSFPDLVRALRAIPATRVILDGEIVAFDARGMPSFARLAERIHKQEPRAIAQAARAVPVQYVVFDILALDALDLRPLPLRSRKQILAELLRGKGFVRLLDHAEGDGHALFALCEAHDLEGVIAKRADSPYVMGPQRSSHWSKLKHVHSDDFVVIGYTRGKGSRATMGALEVASYAGGKLLTRGRVGSGLDDRAIDELQQLLVDATVPKSPAHGELMAAPAGRTFVAPKVVVSVQHSGFTEEGRLRHPVYRGVRRDVTPEACLAAPGEEREAALVEAAPAASTPKPRARVQLTNPSKIFWPGEGITKSDLVGYYDAIADTLLPYLRDRPVLMVRYPDGIAGKHFYQWNAPAGTPSWVRTEIIRDDEEGRDITFFRVEDRDTLLYIANLGCIPLHILAGRFEDLDRCDFLTIDFDLGPAPFEHAVTLTRELRAVLDELGLPGFPKTSGQTGLHVLVPMGGAPFTAATALAALLGRILHDRHPTLTTLERMRRNRPNALYIDTGQTGRSRAIVAPYSVRAHPGATVSTPLSWDEVSAGLVPARHSLFSVPERVAVRGDAMAELLRVKPDLARATERIEALLRDSRRG
jgi:bifunctional non-homologous end joining protein LigD